MTKRKAHKTRKAKSRPTSTGSVYSSGAGGSRRQVVRRHDLQRERDDELRASEDNPGPPGIAHPQMHRTRPVRKENVKS